MAALGRFVVTMTLGSLLFFYQAFVMSKMAEWFMSETVTLPFKFWLGISLVSNVLLIGVIIAISQVFEKVSSTYESNSDKFLDQLGRTIFMGVFYTLTLGIGYATHLFF